MPNKSPKTPDTSPKDAKKAQLQTLVQGFCHRYLDAANGSLLKFFK